VRLTRRAFLAALVATPAIAQSDARPIRLGVLVPRSGPGAVFGPQMLAAIAGVIDEVNALGGVLGRKVAMTVEDCGAPAEAVLASARRMVEDEGSSILLGVWTAPAAAALAPWCQENGVVLFTATGADQVGREAKGSLFFRTQPSARLILATVARYLAATGAPRLAWLGPRGTGIRALLDSLAEDIVGAGEIVLARIYDSAAPDFAVEAAEVMGLAPDAVIAGGFALDTGRLLLALRQGGYRGRILAPAHAVTSATLSALPRTATDGVLTYAAWPARDGAAYRRAAALIGRKDIDFAAAQAHDQACLALLAIAAAGGDSGPAIAAVLRRVSQGGGRTVAGLREALPLIGAGTKVDFEGASGPCDFADNGEVTQARIRLAQVRDGLVREVGLI